MTENTYFVVSREWCGETKYLCIPKTGKKRISWSKHFIRAHRFQDDAEAQGEASVWIKGKVTRLSDGI